MSRRPPSVQAVLVDLAEVRDGVLVLRDGSHRAILEVGAVNLGLLSADEQEALLATYAAVLNSLTFPVQLLVRVEPVDWAARLQRLEAALATADPALAELARDHLAFLRHLAGGSRVLLERHYYLILPAEERECSRGLSWPGRRRRADPDRAAEELARRCDEGVRQLARCGLTARRLDDLDIARLLQACWCPETARRQRLRPFLPQALAPVVYRDES